MEPIKQWWATVPSWAQPVLLAAGIGIAVGISAWIITKAIPAIMQAWINHLVERTLRDIDAGLAERVPIGTNIYDRDVRGYLGFWRFLQSRVMDRLEKRGLIARLRTSGDGACWLRLS
jgi:hypothetical protein